jgi:hypothetical protein
MFEAPRASRRTQQRGNGVFKKGLTGCRKLANLVLGVLSKTQGEEVHQGASIDRPVELCVRAYRNDATRQFLG